MSTAPEPGLRERKKQRTRRHIAETARRLFSERGFEHVTVAEIARAAEVAEATVFNYFPTKEDLFYWQLEAFEERLTRAVRDRPPGTSVLAAFSALLTGAGGVLAFRGDDDADATERLHDVTRLVTGSPALLAREHQVFARYADTLAALLAEESGAEPGDVVPRVAANALLGLHRALIDHVRAQALAGVPASVVREDVIEQARRGVARLEAGLADYGVAP